MIRPTREGNKKDYNTVHVENQILDFLQEIIRKNNDNLLFVDAKTLYYSCLLMDEVASGVQSRHFHYMHMIYLSKFIK